MLSLEVIGRNPPLPLSAIVQNLAVPPSVRVPVQHLQSRPFGESHGLLIAMVIRNRDVHLAEVVVDDVRLGFNRGHGQGVFLRAEAEGFRASRGWSVPVG